MNTQRLLKVWLVGWVLFSLACRSAPETVNHRSQALQASLSVTATPTPLLVASAPGTIKLAQIVPGARAQGLQSTAMSFGKLSLKQKLPANAVVTLVPLGVALPAVTTRVTTTVMMDNPCSETLPKLYETELAPITETAWLAAPAPSGEKRFSDQEPFDVCVLYPAVTAARALNRGLLETAQLPKKVLLTNIVAALDVTGDNQPEVLLVEYCCDNPLASRMACDLTCSAVYVRERNGTWRIAETQTPC